MNKQSGQILLILLLVMVVALTISLSIIQRSLSDLANASKVEQSSRAFSAAEAGIEKALGSNGEPAPFSLDNMSNVQVKANIQFPEPGKALEYPPLAKEDIAHVWLADYTDANPLPPEYYRPKSIGIYWGNPNATNDKAAIALTVVFYDRTGGGKYDSKKFFFDSDSSRISQNKFDQASCGVVSPINTNLSRDSISADRQFYCYQNIDLTSLIPANSYLVLLRARLLYNTTSQPFAVAPLQNNSIPYQASIFTSTGTAGETKRKIQVFQINKVVPFYFDFAIFSTGEISK